MLKLIQMKAPVMVQSKPGIAIVGLGLLTRGVEGLSGRAWQAEAVRLAIKDAGLEPKDIEGAVDLRHDGGRGAQPVYVDGYPRILGLPVKFYFNVSRGGAIASWGIASAAKFLELGIAKYVVIATMVDDWTKSHSAGVSTNVARIDREGYFGKMFGDSRAVNHHTFFASRHIYEYGTTAEQFGSVAVQTRKWANMNPLAKFYDKSLTLEEYLKSPYLVYPYRLFDISVVTDGAVAAVLTKAENAERSSKPPVYVRGMGFGEAMAELWWEKKNYTHLAVEPAKRDAFHQAGIKLEDLDFAQLYDCFTGETILQLEDYGWAQKGKGGKFAEEGRIGPGGDIPVNTGGGLLSAYHIADMTGLSEAVMQLRGEAGKRQIRNAKIGIVTGHGGEVLSPGMCSSHSTLALGVEP